jgi:hypothetical protein
LQTINTNSRQKVYLEVYNNGVLSQVDTGTNPTLSIYDADNDSTVLTGFSNLSAYDETPAGIYSYTLTPAVTNINRVLEIRWTYVTGGVTVNQTDFYAVESPYCTISEAMDFLSVSPHVGDSNYMDPKQIISAEKLARTIIEGYTGIKFYTYYGSQEIWGIGADAVELTERILEIDQVYEDDIQIIDNTQVPVFNTFGFKLVITQTGKQVRIDYPGWDLRYDNQIDPTILYYGRFRSGARYKFVGQMGYKYVPEDIKLASMMLINDIVSNDYNWRNKYLQKVDLSEISFEMAKGAFNGTGNVAVDNILDQYRNINIVII